MISRGLALRALRLASAPTVRRTNPVFTRTRISNPTLSRSATHSSGPPPSSGQTSGGPTLADEKIDDITEIFHTAQDEFEIAYEETDKQTVYAEGDRKAAREELDRLQEAYQAVVNGEDRALAEEVSRRIGQRVRELQKAVENLEQMAQEHD